eukprot:jgi/Chlat1/4964/Chrsp32S08947
MEAAAGAAAGGLWRVLQRVGYGAAGLAAVAVAALVAFQHKLVYVPVLPGQLARHYEIEPSIAPFRFDYEDVWLRARDGVRLHAWLLKQKPSARGPTVLFFQENAGSILFNVLIERQFVAVLVMMTKLKCNILMLSYRGFGASEGSPSEWGIKLDAQAALDYLLNHPDIDNKQLISFGRSLGGAVAAHLAAANPGKLRCVVLENTFTSIVDMAGVVMPFLKYFLGKGRPLNPLVRSPWRTIDIIKSVTDPVLLLSSKRDELVPPEQMRRLQSAAAASAVFVEFERGTHMDTWFVEGDRYWRVIEQFFQLHLR